MSNSLLQQLIIKSSFLRDKFISGSRIGIVMRVQTGVFGLDPLLGGGFLPNTINMILGSTGVGKTILSLQFILQGLKNNERCLFISFDMDKDFVIRSAESLGWDLKQDLIKIGKFFVEDIRLLNNELLNFIIKNSDGKTRIVIDSFTPLVSTLDYTMRRDVSWFFDQLRKSGTALITVEEPISGCLDEPSITIPAFLCDCLIHMKKLGYGEVLDRILRIVKHRNSWHAEGVYPYKIFKGLGIVVDSKHYVESVGKDIEIYDILSEGEIRDISEDLRRKIELALSEGSYDEEEVRHLIRWVIECYRKFERS